MEPQDRKPVPLGFWLHVLVLVLLNHFNFAMPQSIITTLPGYNGNLPFKLETGYISVGEKDEVQLFYYFIESEGNPRKDPLVLWLTGGPGCSAFSGLVYEIGPLAFDISAFDGNLPTFLLNPYSWTKVASIIFLDSPVGTGFSYATKPSGYYTSDSKTAQETYLFLQKWLLNHTEFLKHRIYIAGDSYGGKVVPMVALEISKGNEAGIEPHMFLQGYLIGNPGTDLNKDENERIPYAHRMGLISDEYYELAKSSCNGEYLNPDPSNFKCLYALQLCKQCTKNIFLANILEPSCKFSAPKPGELKSGQLLMEAVPIIDIRLPLKREEPWCRNNNYVTSDVWANDPAVQEALHVRKGTITEWVRCNKSLPGYEQDVTNVVEYHRNLSKKSYVALVYSGDHDMVIPYIATLKWIRYLNFTLDDDWRQWIVDGQVAGYTERYKENQFYLTFATVKGAGHTAPEYKPKECLAMVERFFSNYPL